MTSRERMLSTLNYDTVDYIPCCFMIFFNLYNKCKSEEEFVLRQLDLGLDAFAHVGFLKHSLHPDATYKQWSEVQEGTRYFYQRIDTPKGPLIGKIRQTEGWPDESKFSIFNDWIVPRAEKVFVDPEKDLEKLPYIFGAFNKVDIEVLKESAKKAKKISDDKGLLRVGGWKGSLGPGVHADYGVMGVDAMAWLSGYQNIMILSITKPDIIKEYADIIHRWNIKQIEIYLDVTDADLIIRRGWYETTEFWTPEAYRNIIAPTIKKEAELVHQAGKKYGYIITSAFFPILDDILDTGVDVIIGLDPKEGKGTDMQAVKDKLKERKRSVWGGVSGAMTIELETEKETEDAVMEAINVLGKRGGFILSPVDNVREDTEKAWRNTYRFINTWKKYRHA